MEIAAILGPAWAVEDLTNRPEIPSPEETGATFAENAAIKAVAASQLYEGYVLADDSGLEVDALQGAPGVRSARYAGEEATDAENRSRLVGELRALALAPGADLSARFRCVMALARHGAVAGNAEGAVEGKITLTEQGSGGFGYDCLFIPEGYTQTFGELPAEVKNALSHRSRALQALRSELEKLTNPA